VTKRNGAEGRVAGVLVREAARKAYIVVVSVAARIIIERAITEGIARLENILKTVKCWWWSDWKCRAPPQFAANIWATSGPAKAELRSLISPSLIRRLFVTTGHGGACIWSWFIATRFILWSEDCHLAHVLSSRNYLHIFRISLEALPCEYIST
jgi:hypothetical protein